MEGSRGVESKKLNRRIVLGLALGFLVYVLIAFLGDLDEVARAGTAFPWVVMPAVLALAFCNYLIRLVRWNVYLRALDVEVGQGANAVVFFAGLVMSITPGKFGELLKAQYLKNINGTSRSRTAPAVLAERLTDLIGILFLASFGVFQVGYGAVVFVATSAVIVAALVVISSRRISLALLRIAARLPVVGRIAHKLEESYESIAALVRPGRLAAATAMGILAWGCECIGFHLVINAFVGVEVDIRYSVFIYAFATLVGAVSMLPGGLGATEGTMTGLLMLMHIPAAVAITATLITRLATLWFAVLIGLAVTVLWRKLLEGSAAPQTEES